MEYKMLFTPMNIGTVQIKNRVVMPPMMLGFGQFNGCPTKEMMDYYERTMTNHILGGREHGATGETVYFMPLAPGFHKEFEHENSCCHGTGMESHFKYADMIYAYQGEKLFVNLFVMERGRNHHPSENRDGSSGIGYSGSGKQERIPDVYPDSKMEPGRKKNLDG